MRSTPNKKMGKLKGSYWTVEKYVNSYQFHAPHYLRA